MDHFTVIGNGIRFSTSINFNDLDNLHNHRVKYPNYEAIDGCWTCYGNYDGRICLSWIDIYCLNKEFAVEASSICYKFSGLTVDPKKVRIGRISSDVPPHADFSKISNDLTRIHIGLTNTKNMIFYTSDVFAKEEYSRESSLNSQIADSQMALMRANVIHEVELLDKTLTSFFVTFCIDGDYKEIHKTVMSHVTNLVKH